MTFEQQSGDPAVWLQPRSWKRYESYYIYTLLPQVSQTIVVAGEKEAGSLEERILMLITLFPAYKGRGIFCCCFFATLQDIRTPVPVGIPLSWCFRGWCLMDSSFGPKKKKENPHWMKYIRTIVKATLPHGRPPQLLEIMCNVFAPFAPDLHNEAEVSTQSASFPLISCKS